MKTLKQQLDEATQHVALTKDEKADMRARLVEYMEYKPIRREAPNTQPARRIKSLPFFRVHHLSGALIIALVVTSSTFGMSMAAGGALPGDLLYGVKVNINEEIKTALLTSEESRVAWERERAERRLTEASQLAAEGRLDGEKQEQVSQLFAEHTEAVVEQVLAFEESDPVLAAEVSSEFEGSLDAHEAVLARLIVEQDEESDESARGLVEQVRTAAMEAGKMSDEAEEMVATADGEVTEEEEATEDATEDASSKVDSANMRERAAYRAQERAEELLTDAEALYAELDPESEMAAQVRAQLDSGNTHMEEGAQALEANDLSRAYSQFRSAAASFQKVVELLEVTSLFAVDIYPDSIGSDEVSDMTVSGDDVDQRAAMVQEARADAQERVAQARTLLLTQEGYDAEDIERANSFIKDAAAYVLRGEIAMLLDEHSDAINLFDSAVTIAQRAIELLERAGEDGDIQEVPTNNDDMDVEEPVVVDPIAPDALPVESHTITHTYKDGVHTYTGSVRAATACTAINTEVMVAESYPEQIRVIVTTASVQPANTCPEVPALVEFNVEARASAEAQFRGLSFDGRQLAWNLVEG